MTYTPDPNPWGHQPNPADGATQAGYPIPAPGWQPNPAAPPPPPPGYPGWPAGPPLPGGQYGPPPGRPSRKPLIIGLSILAAVALIAVIVISVVTFSDSESSKAGDAVTGYLDALSRGDAAAALSYSTDQPGSTDFLTDDILKKQVAQWPISGVRILEDDSGHGLGFGRVHVTAKFGDNTSDVTLSLRRSGKKWKLEHAAIKVQPLSVGDNEAAKTLLFFGTSVGNSPVYVFPGFVDATSSNSNVAVKQKRPFLLDALSASSSYFNDFDYTLSDAGQSATMSGISAALAACSNSNQLAPRGCPQHAFDPDIVDGTVAWGTPDMSDLKLSIFDPYHLEARFIGNLSFPLTAKTKSGGTKTGVVKGYVSAKSDLAQSPPEVSMR